MMRPFRARSYTKPSTQVYYDHRQRLIIENSHLSAETIIFDSIFEFNVWRVLFERDKLAIKLHKKVVTLNWFIDFECTIPKKGQKPQWLDKFNISPNKDGKYWIDAKGVLDSKTVQRIRGMDERVQKKITLITPRKIIHKLTQCNILSMDELGGYDWLKANPIGRMDKAGKIIYPKKK